MILQVWQKVNICLNRFLQWLLAEFDSQFHSQFSYQYFPHFRTAIALSADIGNTDIHTTDFDQTNFQQLITNTLLNYKSNFQSYFEQSSDTDSSDFDLLIDAIMIPEPIDQPIPIEPVASSDD